MKLLLKGGMLLLMLVTTQGLFAVAQEDVAATIDEADALIQQADKLGFMWSVPMESLGFDDAEELGVILEKVRELMARGELDTAMQAAQALASYAQQGIDQSGSAVRTEIAN